MNKTYVVTGISRGLGKAVASLLLEKGHTVIGTYNANAAAAQELQQKYPHPQLTIRHVDLLNSEDLDDFTQGLTDVQLDGIVNSAGVFLEIDFEHFDKQAFEDTFRINAFAPLYLVNNLSHNLKDGASIVNIASNDALVGAIVGLAYSASKAALINITQSLANTLASRNIRANVIAPGWMGDGMQAPPELLELAAQYNPLKRAGAYDEVAKAVWFMLSEDASYVNGTTLIVDGGDMATNYLLQKESELL
ncbi:MAG TPA: SDR family oxidoreductase [Candidatus Saccharimonadales bacterium]|nr:SDR family oxidoreductase [Candidatus Saccharimonadales bacterium]